MGAVEFFDVIIVGAGSAGCALANRLTENPDRTVALVEAGPDFKTIEEIPEEILSYLSKDAAHPGSPWCWIFEGQISEKRSQNVPRGRLLGGSSAVNGTYFIRGTREDFDQWASLGNDQWSYDKVLPYFKRLEHDLDFKGEFHGADGPIPIVRDAEARHHPITNALFESAFALGFPEEPDKNAPGVPGVGMIPRNRLGTQRASGALWYILPIRDRKNLQIRGEHVVRRVLFERKKAIGVEVQVGANVEKLFGEQIVLSAGAIKSPHLLQLSGIGPADVLRDVGIDVICDAPGVGRGLSDHAHVTVNFQTADVYPNGALSSISHANLHLTSEGSNTPGDMEILDYCGTKVRYGAALGSAERGAAPRSDKGEYGLSIGLHQPESTGEITLVSTDPTMQPKIWYNLLSTAQDLKRMRDAVRTVQELLATDSFRQLQAVQTTPNELDCSSDDSLNEWIHNTMTTTTHASRSCHMGPDADPTAVVDQYCKVKGVDNLRVIDTSIMPIITSRGPSATATMLGERASDFFD